MKYVVRVREEQIWTVLYVVDANSADEASETYYENGEIYSDSFEDVDNRIVLDVLPYEEEEKDSAIKRLKQEGRV